MSRAPSGTATAVFPRSVALEARNAALQSGESLLAARSAQQLASAAAEQGTLSLADSLLNEAYDAALECGDLDLAADLACALGEAQERAGALPQAMSTLRKFLDRIDQGARRIKGFEADATTYRLADVLSRIGCIALRAHKLEDAKLYLVAALEKARAVNDHLLANRVLGDLASAQAASGDVESAFGTLQTALQNTQLLGDHLATAKLYHLLARLHLSTGRIVEAQELAKQSIDLSMDIGWSEGEALGAALIQQINGVS